MQLTAILSDLNSLRACDHTAALALVSSRPVSSTSTKASSADSPYSQNDADLQRPHELRALHKNIKLAYGTSTNSAPTLTILELQRARGDVDRAVLGLGLENTRHHTGHSTEQTSQPQLEQGPDMDYDEDDAWA